MPTVRNILDDVNLRYRNTFQDAQKIVWLNEEQRELFGILEIDSAPIIFTTVQGNNLYPFPDQFDVTGIKVATYQMNDSGSSFSELPYLRNDDRQEGLSIPWYTIVSNKMYLSVPGGVPGGRKVYIYSDAAPRELTAADIDSIPDLPTKYQELLKLGILERICAARKDIVMKNNYSSEKEMKIQDMVWNMKMKEPEFMGPIDVNPRVGGSYYGGTVADSVSRGQ